MPEHPEIIAVIKAADDVKTHKLRRQLHSDFSFLERPPSARCSTPRRASVRGDTLWASMYLAYEALSTAQALPGWPQGGA